MVSIHWICHNQSSFFSSLSFVESSYIRRPFRDGSTALIESLHSSILGLGGCHSFTWSLSSSCLFQSSSPWWSSSWLLSCYSSTFFHDVGVYFSLLQWSFSGFHFHFFTCNLFYTYPFADHARPWRLVKVRSAYGCLCWV